jgi:oligopeptide transport system permease protein
MIKKLASLLVTMFIIVTATFVLMKSIPGDPLTQEKAIPPEILAALRAHYGLDDPLYVQYGRYLKSVVTFNLGPSFKYKGRTVNDIIKDGFPVSAVLGLEALILSIGMGITLGAIAAIKQNRWQDYSAMCFAVLGISIPSFILATMLQYVFAMKLGLLPVARWGTFSHTILPAISLAAAPTAFIARLTRSNLLEVLQQDYIKTAKAKGLSPLTVTVKHALRNAVLPVITYLGQLIAGIFVGSFIIERIFGIPGLGQWFVTSVTNRDYTVIIGTTVFYSAFLLTSIFFVDIIYTLVDPRIKYNRPKGDVQ